MASVMILYWSQGLRDLCIHRRSAADVNVSWHARLTVKSGCDAQNTAHGKSPPSYQFLLLLISAHKVPASSQLVVSLRIQRSHELSLWAQRPASCRKAVSGPVRTLRPHRCIPSYRSISCSLTCFELRWIDQRM